ncbi:hypothetical protein N7G274_004992 [Stereocaulon virgatum]|uniref:Uncharacterized protein n=1 Tax=Stereocaulon virgatum TaxID=373712 RepID=A0ABR4ACR5_9LECA
MTLRLLQAASKRGYADINHEAIEEEAIVPPQHAGNVKADTTRSIEFEMVVLSSFRSSQLRRLADLQDERLRLVVTSVHLPAANVSNVNESNADPSTTNAAPVPVQDEIKTLDAALSAHAKVLRNYETLSSNALSWIPVDARLVGAMDSNRAEHELKLQTMQRVLAYVLGNSSFDEVMELRPICTQRASQGKINSTECECRRPRRRWLVPWQERPGSEGATTDWLRLK